MKQLLRKLAEHRRYGVFNYQAKEILVKFWEKEGELVGAFFIPEENTDEGIMFSAEIYRAVDKKENVNSIIEDLEDHIKSLFK